MHTSWKSYHHCILEAKFSLVDWTFITILSKDSDDEGAID